MINEIFKETHLQIFIHCPSEDINLIDNDSIVSQICDSLFNSQKQRLIVQLNKENLESEIKNFIKDYLVPNYKYYCLFENNLHLKFIRNSYQLVKCEYLLEDVKLSDDQLQTIINYHSGKTNHRGILETNQKLKQKYYWPNMYIIIQKYINNCNLCQLNKYDRMPYELNDNLTKTPYKPFQIINIDVLTLESVKYLTIVDQFSKFAQIHYLKNLNAKPLLTN